MNNGWTAHKRDSILTPKIWLPEASQAAAMQMTTIHPEVGPEAVLVLKDSHPKAKRLFRSKGLWLRLNAGLWTTSHGTILFFAWFVPPARFARSPVVLFELGDPSDPDCLTLLDAVGKQSHLHVLLYAGNEYVRFLEVPNIFRFPELAAMARDSHREDPVTDWDAATDEFGAKFDPSLLVEAEAA
jgi:hypothetical protein